MAVIGINYEEPNPETYKSIEISYAHLAKRKVFESGNFIVDWYNHNKWIAEEMDGELSKEHHFSNSSSVDHFIMDGANVESRYLKIDENEVPYLTEEYDYLDPGTELFIPKGEKWNWEQLKQYVKDESRTTELPG
jgi:hypothetical protein